MRLQVRRVGGEGGEARSEALRVKVRCADLLEESLNGESSVPSLWGEQLHAEGAADDVARLREGSKGVG